MKTIAITICCLCLALAAWGQPYKLQGQILDSQDESPLIGVKVFDPVTGAGALTDEDGKFEMHLSQIPDQLQIRYEGYPDTSLVDIRQRWPAGTDAFDLGKIPMRNGAIPSYTDIGPPRWPLPIEIKSVMIIDYINQMDKIFATQYMRGDLSSIEQGMNLVPGVRFESRGPGGSRRLAIRGSFLRSPFGVREVKAYLDDAPLTSPDGSTPLELIDPISVNRTEILKGPCASEYGPVSNGVVRFVSGTASLLSDLAFRKELRPYDNTQKGAGGYLHQTVGAYGYLRSAAQFNWNEQLSLTYVRQRYAGYRDQESNAKDFLQLQGEQPFKRHKFTESLLLYQGTWGLPGSLDRAQVASDPRQALPISKALDAHVSRSHLRITLGDLFPFGNEMYLHTTAYFHLAVKVNPFGTSAFNQGYKIENSQGLGGRTIWTKALGQLELRLGAEYQVELVDGKQFENILGSPGALQIGALTRSTQTHAFAEIKRVSGSSSLTGQASIAQVRYNQQHAYSALAPIAEGKSQLSPVAAGSLQWGYCPSNHQPLFFLKAATSYAPPALLEITDSVGRMRSDLKPESGINFEWRGVSDFWGKKLHGEANFYHHSIWNTIVPLNLSNGRIDYQNQGRTTQMGVEAMLEYRKYFSRINHPNFHTRQIHFQMSGAYQYYYFNDYALNGESFRGKMIPGVPRCTWNALVDIALFSKIPDLQLTTQVVGKSYLENANTASQPTYCLLNMKLMQDINFIRDRSLGFSEIGNYSYQFVTAKITPFAGINNLLNTQYTNFPQLNAAANRYYNPAPGRNWYAGLDFRF
jgi:iron complex outermembrane recepter protein